jgi:hypothetical protein
MQNKLPDAEDIKVSLPTSSKIILWVAGGFTFVWMGMAIYIVTQTIGGMLAPDGLNEWGDFVAGVSAPIAFIWLVVAVILQSAELREQRKELALTRQEVKDNRAVMDDQAGYIGAQTKIMTDEHKAAEASDILDACIELIATRLRQYFNGLSFSTRVDFLESGGQEFFSFNARANMYEDVPDKIAIAKTTTFLRNKLREWKVYNQQLPNKPLTAPFPHDLNRVYSAVVTSCERINNLPESFKLRAETLEIPELKRHLDTLAELTRLNEVLTASK